MATKKLYSFNVRRYGHNLELAYNHFRNRIDEKDTTDEEWESFEKIQKVYGKIILASNGFVAPVPYDIWKEATEISAWAEMYRDQCNARRENRYALQ